MWSKSQDKNLNILRTKRAFKIKWKAFFIIFKGLSVAKKLSRTSEPNFNTKKRLLHFLLLHFTFSFHFLVFNIEKGLYQFLTEKVLHHFLAALKVFNIEKGLHHFFTTHQVFNIGKGLYQFLTAFRIFQNSYSVEHWWTEASERRLSKQNWMKKVMFS